MARFQATAAFVIGNKRYKAGTTFADSQGDYESTFPGA